MEIRRDIAFSVLKEILMNLPALGYLNYQMPFFLFCIWKGRRCHWGTQLKAQVFVEPRKCLTCSTCLKYKPGKPVHVAPSLFIQPNGSPTQGLANEFHTTFSV